MFHHDYVSASDFNYSAGHVGLARICTYRVKTSSPYLQKLPQVILLTIILCNSLATVAVGTFFGERFSSNFTFIFYSSYDTHII